VVKADVVIASPTRKTGSMYVTIRSSTSDSSVKNVSAINSTMTHDDELDANLTHSKQLKRVGFEAEVEHRQSNAKSSDDADMVRRQAIGAGMRPWTRSVDDLEAVSAQATEADRVSVVPYLDEAQQVDS